MGLLDFLDLVDEHFGALREIAGRIATETTSIGEKMLRRTAEMAAASARAQGQVSRLEARSLFDKTAADMMQYVARVRVEIPLFRDTLQKGAEAAAQSVLIGAALDSTDRGPASDARENLVEFREALIGAYNGTESFRSSVQKLPRMTSVLNNAKRETGMVLQDQLDSMAEGRRIVTETIRTLDVILGSEPSASA